MAIVDIPGALLTADQEEVINMTLREKLSEIIIKTSTELYRTYVVIEKGGIVLYVQLLKALYGCLCSALLLYTKNTS